MYKLLVTAHKSLYGRGPIYLKDLLEWYQLPRCLRSVNEHKLRETRWRLKSFGARCFQSAVPDLWNNILTRNLRMETSIDKFQADLKTHLFIMAYSWCIIVLLSCLLYIAQVSSFDWNLRGLLYYICKFNRSHCIQLDVQLFFFCFLHCTSVGLCFILHFVYTLIAW